MQAVDYIRCELNHSWKGWFVNYGHKKAPTDTNQTRCFTEINQRENYIMSIEKNESGYVYILSNPVMPGILKIGRSNIGGRVRAVEIYTKGGTGVPMPYKMEFEMWCKDCVFQESSIHENLNEFRINKSREFFKISLSDAIQEVITSVCFEHDLLVRDADSTYSGYEYIQLLEEELRQAKQELSLIRRERIRAKLQELSGV